MSHAKPAGGFVRKATDFGLDILAIIIGVGITLYGDQVMDDRRHARPLAETRAALCVERRIDVNRFAVSTAEFYRTIPHLEENLTVLKFLQKHPGAPIQQWPGHFDWVALSIIYIDNAWRTAGESAVLQYMPQSEVQWNAELYRRLEQLNGYVDSWRVALSQAEEFAFSDSTPGHMSRSQIDRQILLTSGLLTRYLAVANAQRNLAYFFPKFQPAPTLGDIDRTRNLLSDPDDVKAASALIERVQVFDRAQGIDYSAMWPTEDCPNG